MNPAPLAPAQVKMRRVASKRLRKLLHTLLDTQGKRRGPRSEREQNVKKRADGGSEQQRSLKCFSIYKAQKSERDV